MEPKCSCDVKQSIHIRKYHAQEVFQKLDTIYFESKVGIEQISEKFSKPYFCSSNHDLMIDHAGPKKIDCGLREIDANKYRRNYVVNEKFSPSTEENSLQFNWSTSKLVFLFFFGPFTQKLNLAGISSSAAFIIFIIIIL